MVGRHHDFEIALQKLRGPHTNIRREAEEIQVQSKPENRIRKPVGTWHDILFLDSGL